MIIRTRVKNDTKDIEYHFTYSVDFKTGSGNTTDIKPGISRYFFDVEIDGEVEKITFANLVILDADGENGVVEDNVVITNFIPVNLDN